MGSRPPDDRFLQLREEFQRNPQSVEQRSAEELTTFLLPDIEEAQGRLERRSTAREAFVGRRPIPPPDPALSGLWDPARGLLRPRSLQQVQQLIDFARNRGSKVRVLGSQHSVEHGILGRPSLDFNLLLDGELRKIERLNSRTADGFELVRVGAGCFLGPNPSDPSQRPENTLTHWLEARGLAVPSLGGITHQTIAGFIQTGSDGGSLTHSFSDAVEELELVDGTGEVRTFRRGTDEFAAAGVSMGLFGVLTRVTLKVGTSYFVEGEEGHQELTGSLLAPGIRGDALIAAFQKQEYLRLNWYPQSRVQRVTQWTGRQVARNPNARDPYKAQLRDDFTNVMAALVLSIVNDLLVQDPNSDFNQRFIGALMKPFLPLGAPQTFHDAWHLTLPMDNPVRTDDILKVLFTELWFPLDKTDEVLGILRGVLVDQRVAGNLAVELYAGKPSPFWLSPAHEGGSLRVDPYRWAHDAGRPEDHFEHYWRGLLDVEGVRFHWGKYLPELDRKYGQTLFNLDYLRSVYPRMEDWLTLRQKLDPQRLFLNEYWEKLFLPIPQRVIPVPTPPTRPPPNLDLLSKGKKLLGQWARAASRTCLTLLDKLYGVAVRE